MSKDRIVSFYKFCSIQDLDSTRITLKSAALGLGLKGTVLLAHEGINASLYGQAGAVQEFLDFVQARPEIGSLDLKENDLDLSAFRRMLVKVKKEIVTMNKEGLAPAVATGGFLSPNEFKAWMDEGREFILVDTRNHYEVALGTFKNAINPNTQSFSEFPKWVEDNLSDKKNANIVTICTGGVRTEKATTYMKQQGFTNIFQIKGGILRYFAETAQGESAPYWEGECVVFDKRKAIKPDLTPSAKELCFICYSPLVESDLCQAALPAGKLCAPCYAKYQAKQEERKNKGLLKQQAFMQKRAKHRAEVRDQMTNKESMPSNL